ncbi:MAG: hypothetical protein QM611_07695 [Microbacterium sp.]|uniref:hypothetical protein n=1 Tax=Microbacterium sp. TaxID=51671 RepID=UPI0039E21FD9
MTFRALGAAAAAALAVTLTACATPTPGAPSGAPTASGPARVTTQHPVTVLDDGDGAELCVGGVATSLPPQCGGPSLVGWDWADHEGDYDQASGVRWGEFVVTGEYDPAADTFTPTEVVSGRDGEWPAGDGGVAAFDTPCEEPDGGWQVVDESKATPQAMDAVFQAASKLDGFAASWMDQSRNPASAPDVQATMPPEELESAMNSPTLSVVNVRVVGDPAAAEAELRKVWGGMLCVTAAERTEAELLSIMDEVMDSVPGVLGGSPDGRAGTVDISVVWDDGALQRKLDARHGTGVVRVESALVPVS